MFQMFINYLKAHSHAVLATLVVLQNMHVLKGTAGTVVNALVSMASAIGST